MRQQGVPLFLSELTFDGGRFSLAPGPQVFHFHGHDVMWHKERLLNLAVKRLPAQFTKVAWVDADVLFPDDRWYQWASALLDVFDLIQLFDRVDQRDNHGQPIRQLSGLAAYVAEGKPLPFKFDTSRTWPGLAWAARRDLVATHGLLDWLILGGADTYMSIAAFNHPDTWGGWHVQILAPTLRERWTSWAQPFFDDVQGRVGFVPTTAVQLGHGRTVDRRYVERMQILVRHNYDPRRDISAGDDGIWRWSSAKDALHSEVFNYFGSRREDLTETKAPADAIS